jgi:hypothetical protein
MLATDGLVVPLNLGRFGFVASLLLTLASAIIASVVTMVGQVALFIKR